jgi:ribonuclease HI
MAAKNNFYAVWKGRETGIFSSWDDCKRQVMGFEGAQYRGFPTEAAAREAFKGNYWQSIQAKQTPQTAFSLENIDISTQKPNIDSIAVDAACSGNPGRLEYRGVYVPTGEELFRQGVFECGTNNIGEFLALVHGLAMLKKQGKLQPVYSDSVNAIKWVQQKKCKTKLERNEKNAPLFLLIDRAEQWLATNDYPNQILKWETQLWGEIPADFGRK